jgi:hypothetical protein
MTAGRRRDEAYVEQLLRSMGPDDLDDLDVEAPPADLWDRIAAATAEPAATAPDDGDAAPPPAPTPIGTGSRRTGAAPGRRPAWSRPLLVAAAAIGVLVLGAGIVVPRLSSSPSPAEEVAARARLTNEGLKTPYPYAGNARLVNAAGRGEIEVDVPDLPPRPDSYYEVWLLAPDGQRLQSLGTTDGRGRYAVPTGIDPRQYPVVDISREPPDGNPAHSGDSLVRGKLDLA